MYLNHSAQEGTDSFSDSNEGESVVQVHTGSSCDILSWNKRIVKFDYSMYIFKL